MEKLYYDESARSWVYPASGTKLPMTSYPAIGLGDKEWYELHVVTTLEGTVEPVDLSGKNINSLHVAVDIDFTSTTLPMCRTNTPENYDLSRLSEGIIIFLLDAETSSFLAKLDGSKREPAFLHIKGYDPDGGKVLNITPNWGPSDHSIYCEGDIDPGTEELPGLPENYSTTAEMNAVIAAPPVREFSVDGATDWHSTQTSADRYYREQRNGGEWSTAVALVEPVDAFVYVAYASDNAGADFNLTPSDTLKYRAEIHVTEEIATPTITDFSGATWVKYLGDIGETGATGAAGADGQNAFIYVAYASDNAGTDWSMTPSDSLKYRAEIHTTAEVQTPSASDFIGATWVKYIGDNPDGTTPQGTYDSGTTYALNNGVTYNGNYYRSLVADNTGNQPDTSPTYWELMIAKGDTGATNINIIAKIIEDPNFETLVYQLSDVKSYLRFSSVETMSSLKLGVVSANPTYTGNAVIFASAGRTKLSQAGWTASTGVSGAYYRDADIAGITFVTEDGTLIENAASVASLTPGQWGVGDEDSIGSSRLYVYPSAGNNPTTDGDGFYQYDTVSSQTVAVGATPSGITITASLTGYKCLELWRDTFDSNDTLDNGGVVVGMNVLEGAEYNK